MPTRWFPSYRRFADQPRTAAEMSAWLDERLGGTTHPGAWWALRQYAPLLRAPTGGPWSFGSTTSYVAPQSRPVLSGADTSDEALRALVLRYLAGFGPASMADVAQFALVPRARAKIALQALTGDHRAA